MWEGKYSRSFNDPGRLRSHFFAQTIFTRAVPFRVSRHDVCLKSRMSFLETLKWKVEFRASGMIFDLDGTLGWMMRSGRLEGNSLETCNLFMRSELMTMTTSSSSAACPPQKFGMICIHRAEDDVQVARIAPRRRRFSARCQVPTALLRLQSSNESFLQILNGTDLTYK